VRAGGDPETSYRMTVRVLGYFVFHFGIIIQTFQIILFAQQIIAGQLLFLQKKFL